LPTVRSDRLPSFREREFRRTLARILPALAAVDQITLGRLNRVQIERKSDGSEVTAADRAAERLLRRRIRAAWPRDTLVGEEFGGELVDRGRCWTLDPIDGTASYVLGLPTYGTLVGLLIDGQPMFGCIHAPGLGETTYAARGHGCWLRRAGSRPRRVHVAPRRSLRRAQVSVTSLKATDLVRPPGPWRLGALAPAVGRMRFVTDCLQYALLCRGALDGAIDTVMHPWDIAALVPCVLEAGGCVSDLSGSSADVVRATSFVAASSPALRRAICSVVAPRPA
jgi:histidinol-phosphatase